MASQQIYKDDMQKLLFVVVCVYFFSIEGSKSEEHVSKEIFKPRPTVINSNYFVKLTHSLKKHLMHIVIIIIIKISVHLHIHTMVSLSTNF